MKVVETVAVGGLFGGDWIRMTYWDGERVRCSEHGSFFKGELKGMRCKIWGGDVVTILSNKIYPNGCFPVIGERDEYGEKACE